MANQNTRTHYLILALILGSILLAGAFLIGSRYLPNYQNIRDLAPVPRSLKPKPKTKFTGYIQTGSQLEGKFYCPDGLYLVAENNKFLTDQTKVLHLEFSNETATATAKTVIGKKVEVIGLYPAQEAFCEALLCECEDYILVDQIEVLT